MRRSICKSRWQGVAAMGLLLALSGVALAQQAPPTPRRTNEPAPRQAQPQQQQRVTANRPVDQNAATQNTDQAIATCLAISNQEEIELSKIAASEAANPKVKDFANMMIKDHQGVLQQLARFGARDESLSEGEGRRVGTNPRPQDVSGQPQIAVRNQPGVDFLEIKRNIAQVCVANAKKEWTKKEGEKCDVAYLGQQIVAHEQMLAAGQVLREYASPELQKVIDGEMQAAQSHLQHAKQLIHEVAQMAHPGASKERENRTSELRPSDRSR